MIKNRAVNSEELRRPLLPGFAIGDRRNTRLTRSLSHTRTPYTAHLPKSGDALDPTLTVRGQRERMWMGGRRERESNDLMFASIFERWSKKDVAPSTAPCGTQAYDPALVILYLVYGMSIYVCSRNLIYGYKEIRYSTVPGTVCHLFVYFAKCVVPMVSSFRRRCVYCVCVCVVRSLMSPSLTHASRLTPHVSRPPTRLFCLSLFFVHVF